MAYIEFRPLTNVDGETEYDAMAFTDEEAKALFPDLKARLLRGPDEKGVLLRSIDWSDAEVEAFNAKVQSFYELMLAVAERCGVKERNDLESA